MEQGVRCGSFWSPASCPASWCGPAGSHRLAHGMTQEHATRNTHQANQASLGRSTHQAGGAAPTKSARRSTTKQAEPAQPGAALTL